MKNDGLRAHACSGLVLLLLFLSCPGSLLGNWGMEVGRADSGDVISLISDWNAFKRERNRINKDLMEILGVERQKQLLGLTGDIDAKQLFEQVQTYWLMKVLPPLQRIALNPAASCAEAQFAMATMIGLQRQQQLLGIDDSDQIQRVLDATKKMTSLRCREEALDECVATGRFTQILELMTGAERQAQLLGVTADLEGWAEDALQQCAIYELHFVSKTKGGHPPMVIETVRDGKVPIRFELPPGGIKAAMGKPLGEILKGETVGGNNPFFVSIKCAPPTPIMEMVCSPGADSTPIKVGINALDLKHPEFYIERANVLDSIEGNMEAELSKERMVGENKLSFDFAGGMFSLQALIKAPHNPTLSIPFPDWGNAFYMAHKKDQIGGPQSAALKIENIRGGVYPVIFQFTYADQGIFMNFTATDSTEFELIHKPQPKPFRQRQPQDPIRKPLTPRPGR